MATNTNSTVHPFLSNKTYDVLKFLVGILLPGFGTLYFVIAQIWGFPNSQGVNASVNAIAVFLGLLVGYSTKTYNRSEEKYDGDIYVDHTEHGAQFTLGVRTGPSDVAGKNQVLLRVENKS